MSWKERNAVTLAALHPVARNRGTQFLGALEALGVPVLLVQGMRTWQEQEALWAKGRSVPSDVPCRHQGVARPVGSCAQHPLGATVTNARAWQSWHCFGFAFDAAPDDPAVAGLQPDWNAQHPAWRRMLRVGKTLQLDEGAEWRTFPDNPHFYPQELPATPPNAVRGLYQQGGVLAVWGWVQRTYFAADVFRTGGGAP